MDPKEKHKESARPQLWVLKKTLIQQTKNKKDHLQELCYGRGMQPFGWFFTVTKHRLHWLDANSNQKLTQAAIAAVEGGKGICIA